MSYEFGDSSRFFAYGRSIQCSNCNNKVREQLWASYHYEAVLAFFRTTYYDGTWGSGEIKCVCPICFHGFSVNGLKLNEWYNNLGKTRWNKKKHKPSGVPEQQKKEELLQLEKSVVDIQKTVDYFQKLKWWQKRGYLKMLSELGLQSLLREAIASGK